MVEKREFRIPNSEFRSPHAARRMPRVLCPMPHASCLMSRAAYSLVEVMIIAGLLAAVLIPVYELFVSGMRGTARVVDHATALHRAQEPLDVLQNLPWVALRSNWRGFIPAEAGVGEGRFQRIIDVREVEPGRLIRIDVTVKWQDRNGKEKSLRLAALAANQEFGR